MDTQLITELLQWLDLESVKKVTELSANSLLFLYCFAYICNRRAAFIVAFLCVEFLSNSTILDQLNNTNFYMLMGLVYCVLYYHLVFVKEKLRTLAAVVLVVLLDLGMALDANLYPQTETVFYQAYEYFYICVHLCVILSLVNFKILRQIVGAITNRLTSLCCNSYSLSFFW